MQLSLLKDPKGWVKFKINWIFLITLCWCSTINCSSQNYSWYFTVNTYVELKQNRSNQIFNKWLHLGFQKIRKLKKTFSSDDMKWPAKFERRKILQILNEQVVQKCTQCLVKKQFVIGNEALKVFNKVETNLLHHSRKGYRIK